MEYRPGSISITAPSRPVLAGRYPEIKPYDHGMLDGQPLYWDLCGNSDHEPAVVIHGGPGPECSAGGAPVT